MAFVMFIIFGNSVHRAEPGGSVLPPPRTSVPQLTVVPGQFNSSGKKYFKSVTVPVPVAVGLSYTIHIVTAVVCLQYLR